MNLGSALHSVRSSFGFLGKPFPRDALKASAAYLRRNPGELFSVAKNAAGMKISVPLDAIRWLSDHAPKSKKAPKDVAIGAAPPALSLAATAELMGNPLRAGADVTIEGISAGTDELRVSLKVGNLKLTALGAADSPMANLFKAMDLSKPAALLNFLPARPPALVEAAGDRFTVDLLKVPKIASNVLVRRALEVVTPLLSIVDVKTENDHLVVGLKVRSGGFGAALAALKK
jgi:hypothetical protein